ncbi:hydroxyacid dehydrogenase [Streptomyces hainanensis]|uniref:Hydroxyacid dehydrogenase n=1 Tax=Streptomyces hainanensis TaxID=402648 RepID=A0A4R4T6U7_9ACTN|nr:hydroxyacid dehydrogenase [Streptomyces hainanensis]TDC72667.1 hydroxyacid dehydrogenase [Streptomyces hainanensis]
MAADLPGRLFSPAQWARLRKLAELREGTVLTEFHSPAARAALAETEVLITGWGSPVLDAAALDAAPRLRAVLHAAGSVKSHVSPECWRRGIPVTTAAGANAEPVAEFTLAMILLALKRVRAATARYRERRRYVDVLREFPGIGNHRRRVGLVGASRIGRRVVELLRPFSLDVALADPYLTEAEARALGVRLLPLDALLGECDLVSLHAPAIPETREMIDRRRLALLRDGAVLVNTARGSLVEQDALVAELVSGRIEAVLDVTEPEVLSPDSPLYTLENVWLTPHLAGAQGGEVHRLAEVVLDELTRLNAGSPLLNVVLAADLDRMA